MASIYERIEKLCLDRGITGGKMCSDLGMSRSTMTELRKNRVTTLKLEKAGKIADYFGVTVDYLLHGSQNENALANIGGGVSDDDIKFALFGGDGEITDKMYAEVKNFAQYVKQRERDKQK